MGKDKLRRFAENETFPNLIQPLMTYPPLDHALKGKWHENFFHNQAPIVLELGCGRGEHTVNLAEKFPEKNFMKLMKSGLHFLTHIFAKETIKNDLLHIVF